MKLEDWEEAPTDQGAGSLDLPPVLASNHYRQERFPTLAATRKNSLALRLETKSKVPTPIMARTELLEQTWHEHALRRAAKRLPAGLEDSSPQSGAMYAQRPRGLDDLVPSPAEFAPIPQATQRTATVKARCSRVRRLQAAQ